MNAPRLRRKLVLEDAFRVPDGAGGYHIVWQTLGTLWADLDPRSGREREGHALPRSRVPMKITVRAAPPGSPARPSAGQRFREGSRIYNIDAVTEDDPSGHYLCCHAIEETAT